MLEARNAGKAIADARGEMGMVVDTFRYYAGAPERLLGDTIPVAGGQAFTVREPVGVVGLITPWNFPLDDRLVEARAGARGGQHGRAQAGRADAADRAALRRAGARGGAARGRRERRRRSRAAPAGSAWSSTPTSPRSRSPARPRSAARSPPAPPQTIKRVTLELGGKSANIVFADADLEAAAAAAPLAVFGNAGQDCCARSRILVQEQAMDALHGSCSSRAVKALRVGDPLEEATQMGPLISAGQREAVQSFLDDGAPVAFRGSAPEGAGLLVRADGARARRTRRARRPRGGVRADRRGDPVRRRGRGGARSPTTRSTACRARSGRATAPARCASRARWRRACCRSTPTPRCA